MTTINGQKMTCQWWLRPDVPGNRRPHGSSVRLFCKGV